MAAPVSDLVSKRGADLVCTKHLSRLSGSAESVGLLQPETSLEERASGRPAGRQAGLETRPFRPTVLLKSGAQPRGVVPLSPGSGEGQKQGNIFSASSGSERKPVSNQGAWDPVERLGAPAGSKQAKECRKTRLNPGMSQLGVGLTGLPPSSG